jgi:Sec-independent protein translocase protein TatA
MFGIGPFELLVVAMVLILFVGAIMFIVRMTRK